MEEVINDLREVVQPSVNTPWSTVDGMRQSARDHFAMVDRIEQGDFEGFKAVLHSHIFRWTGSK